MGGIIIPLGISATATSLLCLVSAKQAGDPYPVRTSMVFDGFGTCLAALFGSPFGTCLYIVHPAYKRNGAKNGYSLMNGLIYFVLSWFGGLAVIQSIVNPATIGPIVFFVGLQVNEEALNFMPSRHYAAYIIGVFPSIFNWVMNTSGRSASPSDDGSYNVNNLGGSWNGLLAFAQGTSLSLFCGPVFSLWPWTADGWVHHSGHSLHRSLPYLVSSINLRQDLKHGKLPLLNIVLPKAATTILSNGCTLRR